MNSLFINSNKKIDEKELKLIFNDQFYLFGNRERKTTITVTNSHLVS